MTDSSNTTTNSRRNLMLAESWDLSSDNKQIKLNLRKGVLFHDGREFTSDDVKYNMLRVRDPATGGAAVRGTEATGLPASNPGQVHVVRKSEKSLPGRPSSNKYFRHVLRRHRRWCGFAHQSGWHWPVQTFVEWIQGDHSTFSRNKSYWRSDRPYLADLVNNHQDFADAQVQIAQLESGVLHLADSPPSCATPRPVAGGNSEVYLSGNVHRRPVLLLVSINTSVPHPCPTTSSFARR